MLHRASSVVADFTGNGIGGVLQHGFVRRAVLPHPDHRHRIVHYLLSHWHQIEDAQE